METVSKYYNNDQALLKKIEERSERFHYFSDRLCIALIIFFVLGSPFALLSEFNLLHIVASCFAGFMIGGPIIMLIGRCIEKINHRYFKTYEIDVHDDVIRLVGSVSLEHSNIAYRDLLSVRPGYKIADEPNRDFDCCMASVPAYKAELNTKKELEKLGFSVNTIG